MVEVYKEQFLPAVEQARERGEAKLAPMFEKLNGDPAGVRLHEMQSVIPDYQLAGMFLERAVGEGRVVDGEISVGVRIDKSGSFWYVLETTNKG